MNVSLALVVVCNRCGTSHSRNYDEQRGPVRSAREAARAHGWEVARGAGGNDYCPRCWRRLSRPMFGRQLFRRSA